MAAVIHIFIYMLYIWLYNLFLIAKWHILWSIKFALKFKAKSAPPSVQRKSFCKTIPLESRAIPKRGENAINCATSVTVYTPPFIPGCL